METLNATKFWNRVDDLCYTHRRTLMQVCSELDLIYFSVTNQRHRKQIPKIEQIYKMSKYFDVSLDYLVTGKNHTYQNPNMRFIPYLDRAKPSIIESIEILLKMTKEEKKDEVKII